MFGSDWPVCLVATRYRQWTELLKNFISPLSSGEQDDIMGNCAARSYQL
jgi:L-fuconolactonase